MGREKREQTRSAAVILPYEKTGEHYVEPLGDIGDKPAYSAVKRTFDITASALALASCVPAVLSVWACWRAA